TRLGSAEKHQTAAAASRSQSASCTGWHLIPHPPVIALAFLHLLHPDLPRGGAGPDVIVWNVSGIARVGVNLAAVFCAEQLVLYLAHPRMEYPARPTLFEHWANSRL